MPLFFALRFDLRNPEIAGTTMADRYAAAIDMAQWADGLGCLAITVSEHHSSPDGYLPSPMTMLAAMAARTTNARLVIAALIAPFYDPLRLAEDIAVVDQISRGRLDIILAGGYVRDEFEMFGVPTYERGRRLEETVTALRQAFTGEPFEFRGRTVRVTPTPFQPGGPRITLGGSSAPAARRAARIADGFMPSVPEAWQFYRDEMIVLGKPDPGPSPMGGTVTVALAEDVERGWEQMGPFFMHETNAYGAWIEANDGASPYRTVADLDQLRALGTYRIVTPDEYIAELRAAPFPFAMLHPLCGGMPPEVAWESLRLLEHNVMPALA